MLNANNEQKNRDVKPLKGDVGPFRAISSSNKPDVGFLGAPATCHVCPEGPAHCYLLHKTSN